MRADRRLLRCPGGPLLAAASCLQENPMLPSPWCRWAAHAIGRVAATLLLICVPATFTPHLRPIPSQASAADGRWRPLFVGRRAGHTAIYDPVGHRMIAFGGSSNDAWALSLGVPPAWKLLDICGTGPTYFTGHAAIHDPVRGRMVVLANGEVWALSLGCSPQWTRLDVSGSVPPPIDGPRAVYDSARDEMLIFGGNIILSQYGRQLTNRIWVLSLSTNTWTEIVPGGDAARGGDSRPRRPPGLRGDLRSGLGPHGRERRQAHGRLQPEAPVGRHVVPGPRARRLVADDHAARDAVRRERYGPGSRSSSRDRQHVRRPGLGPEPQRRSYLDKAGPVRSQSGTALRHLSRLRLASRPGAVVRRRRRHVLQRHMGALARGPAP